LTQPVANNTVSFHHRMYRKSTRIIKPEQPFLNWVSQLIARRETLWFFVWKDLKVQYQRPVFGLLWSVFQPLVYFGIILTVMQFSEQSADGNSLPFSLYLICGLAIWNFTTSSILGAINSIQSNASIITKAFFPRFYLILSPLIKSTIDYFFVFLIIVILSFYYDSSLNCASVFLAPLALFLTWLTAMGLGAIAATLTVLNRHIKHLIPVLLYALIFLLPVFYSSANVENKWLRIFNTANPITGSMRCLRASFGGEIPSEQNILTWLLFALTFAALGVVSFRKIELTLSDRL